MDVREILCIQDTKCMRDILEIADFSILQKFKEICAEFRASFASATQEGCTHRRELQEEQIKQLAELCQEIETIKSEKETVELNLKILDKEIENVVKEEERVQKEIDDAKRQKEELTLQIVDLKYESQNRKQKRISLWNSIKKACHFYKEFLDFHLKFVVSEKEEKIVKVSFFINDDATNGKYYVHLHQHGSHWKAERIEPTLKKEYLDDLKVTLDFSNQSIANVTAFLCRLRKIFLKYYVNSR